MEQMRGTNAWNKCVEQKQRHPSFLLSDSYNAHARPEPVLVKPFCDLDRDRAGEDSDKNTNTAGRDSRLLT
jgi:hypothetical protein